jgi:hypothetical protein
MRMHAHVAGGVRRDHRGELLAARERRQVRPRQRMADTIDVDVIGAAAAGRAHLL